jgi:hypothetical protein
MLKRVFKWTALVLGLMILVPALALAGFYGYYKSIVSKVPRASQAPGELVPLVNVMYALTIHRPHRRHLEWCVSGQTRHPYWLAGRR